MLSTIVIVVLIFVAVMVWAYAPCEEGVAFRALSPILQADPRIPPTTLSGLKEVLQKAWPRMASEFGVPPSIQPSVVVTQNINQSVSPVGYTQGTLVTLGVGYLQAHPTDVDCCTHELFHVVQSAFGGKQAPSWIVEGLADWARNRYGLFNKDTGWTLGVPPSPGARYTDGYQTTGRFFVWMESRAPGFAWDLFNEAFRKGAYSEAWWKSRTGQSVDELWAMYVRDTQFRTLELEGRRVPNFTDPCKIA